MCEIDEEIQLIKGDKIEEKLKEKIHRLIVSNDFEKDLQLEKYHIFELELLSKNFDENIKLPIGVSSLKLWANPSPEFIASLPKSVKKLYFYRSGKDLEYQFPEQITHLMLPPKYNSELNFLPNLKVLSIGYCYKQKLELSDTLEELYFNSYFNSTNGGITIDCFGSFPILDKIPNSLRILQIPIKLNLVTDMLEPDFSIFDFEMLGEKLIDNNIEILKIVNFHDLNEKTIDKIDVVHKLIIHKKIKLEQYKCHYKFL